MRDVLIYLVDSVPAASLSAVYHALAYETTTQPVQDLLARHPSFASALPRPSTTSRTTALVGSQVMGESVALDDRPWEMLEHMTVQVLPKHQDLFLASKPLKDTSSIPIALFKPQLTRDAVPTSEEDTPAWDHASSERTLGNGFAGEPVSARQAATVLYARLDGAERERELEADREQRERERELEAQDRERERELSVPIPLSVAGSAPVTPTKSVASGVSTSRRSSGRVHKGTGTGADPIALVSDSSDEDEEPLAKRARTSKNATSTRTNAGGKVPRKTAATGAGATGKKAPAKAPAKKAANGKDKSRRKS
jgi:mediator of RNA polymerase II transcription subunit 12